MLSDSCLVEKQNPDAIELLDELVRRCEEESISNASDYLLKLYRDQTVLPSLWFNVQTDGLLPPTIVKIISILRRKPPSSWEKPDYFILTNLMVLACDGAVVEERAGMNASAKRWLNVFSECFASLPSDLLPFSLWLLTITSPHDTLIKPALERLDERLLMTGVAWEDPIGWRNRSLCRLKRQLLDVDIQFGRDLNKRLKATNACGHFCSGCVAWSFRVVVTFPRYSYRRLVRGRVT